MKDILGRIYTVLPDLLQHRSLLIQVAQDFYREKQGANIFFPLDFFEIHNFLFPLESSNGEPEIVKYYFENLSHPMILLPPTAWEFINYLEKQSTWLRTIYHPSATIIDEFLKSEELKNFREKIEQGGSSEEIVNSYHRMGKYRRILDFLRKDAIAIALEKPAQNFMRYLETGKITTLENILGGQDWNDVDNSVLSIALDAFDLRRPDQNKKTPNRVDALNLAVTFALNNNFYQSINGVLFLIVTHGKVTEQIYSNILWNNDPVDFDSKGTKVSRNHYYCAYHAFFEKLPDPLTVIRKILGDLDTVLKLKKRFEAFFHQYGREQLENPNLDSGIATEIRNIRDDLDILSRKIDFLDNEINAEVRSPLFDPTDFQLNDIKGKNQIQEILAQNIVLANSVIKNVLEKLEPILRNSTTKLVNRKFEKIFTLLTPSTDGINPQKEEVFLIRAELKGAVDDRPVDLNKSYDLITEIDWYLGNREIKEEQLEINVSVQGEDIRIAPSPMQTITLEPNERRAKIKFTISPTNIGTKNITISYFHQLSHLGQIDLEVKVIGNKEPPYRGFYNKNIVSDQKPVPSPRFSDLVTAQIMFYRDKGDHYKGHIHCEGNPKDIDVEIPSEDVNNLNQKIQTAAANYLISCASTEIDEEDQKLYLADLAEYGSLLQELVFTGEVNSFLREAISGNQKTIIQISTDDLLLPWDLLYDGNFRKPSWGNFWGMKYIVSRITIKGRRDGRFISPKIPVELTPKLGIFTDLSLDSVRLNEVSFFRSLHANKLINLDHFPPIKPDNDTYIEDFFDYWDNNFNLAHFACHAVTEGTDRLNYYLQISDNCPLFIKQLLRNDFQVHENPLILLNACHTGVINIKSIFNFARIFLRSGARGVLATECEIPDVLAYQFTEAFYKYFLSGKSLGESLLLTRWYLLKNLKNPVGLFYAMYAPESIRLVKSHKVTKGDN